MSNLIITIRYVVIFYLYPRTTGTTGTLHSLILYILTLRSVQIFEPGVAGWPVFPPPPSSSDIFIYDLVLVLVLVGNCVVIQLVRQAL